MFSYPGSGAVLEHLGDKVVHGLGRSVSLTRADLEEYRRLKPEWVVRHSPRGLANWIQDQLWFYVCAQFDDVAGVVLYEEGVTREVFAHDVYRIRVKRHHLLGEVSTYPTQAALEFLGQPAGQLPGMEEVHLIAGYEWDRDELRIVRPVLSLRDGRDNILWLVELPETAEATAVVVDVPPVDRPGSPGIAVPPRLGSQGATEVDGGGDR